MANETEVIREKMEETRNDLSDKLEQLEKQVVDTVQGATSAVADSVQQATSAVTDAVQSAKDVVDTVKDSVQGTVDSVKDSVQDTMDSVHQTMSDTVEGVKQTFDLPRQVDRHPWLMVGGAVAVGFVAAKLLYHGPAVARAATSVARSTAATLRPTAEAVGSATAAAGGLMATMEGLFGPEINKVKELALGALLGVIRDMAVQAAPETMAPQVREIIDGFTSKLGGKPIEGPVLGPRPEEEKVHDGPMRRF